MMVRDSIQRELKVRSARMEGDTTYFTLECRDSLFARLYDGAPAGDQMETLIFSLGKGRSGPRISFGGTVPAGSGQVDLRRFFDFHTYPEDAVEERDFPRGRFKVVDFTDGMVDVFSDSMVYAQGVGFIRRAKFLVGQVGMSERVDYELVEFMGQPFDSRPVSLGTRPKSGPKTGSPGSLPWKAWTGKDRNPSGKEVLIAE